MSYDNTNRGTIGKNTRKTEENHPDIAGTINVDGKDYWLNGWHKTNSQDGSTFYSLTVKPKEARATTENNTGNGFSAPAASDDIPFAPEWRG